jgi:two-component system chemotaxis sensor kinase CheA
MTSGAIPLEDGTVAVMLDADAIFEKAKSGAGASVPAAARPAAAKTSKILVVDDSITSRSLERTILEANGYQVELAVDGLEALERLQTDHPDLVITDVAMPRLTGFQLLERMKNDELLKAIPVILITSLESREDQERGLSLGAGAYIVKRKFDQRELLRVIRQIL